MLKHEAPGEALVLQPLSWGLARFSSSLSGLIMTYLKHLSCVLYLFYDYFTSIL